MWRSMHSLKALMVTICVCSLAAAACSAEVSVGSKDTLDMARIESGIASEIAEQTGFGVKTVQCPDNVPVKAGEVFTCTVVDDQDSRATVEVTQKDDKGGVTWKLQTLLTSQLISEIQTGIEQQTGTTVESVECPQDVVIAAGETFECIVTDDAGNTATVEATQQDDRGNVSWELQG